jgi:hypothetical protein
MSIFEGEEDAAFAAAEISAAVNGAEVSPLATGVINVRCPEGTGPGDVVLVETANGAEIEIEIPDGVCAGDEFEVFVGVAEDQVRAA